MVTQTLDNMRKGGIWDHVGFGFHRYSTDRSWKLPHFEKMLYDQALLARAYIDGYLLTKKQLYSQTVKDIFTFVLRDLYGSEGGFYASVDADSQGEEGKYYLWTYQQLKEVLNPEDFRLAVNVFNIQPEGNISLENDLNILYINEDMDKLSRKLKLPSMQLNDMISGCLQKLLAARKKRQHPFIDPKILADWNGLMIAAMARGGRVLDRPIYIEAAKKAADFIIKNMIKEGRLYHCWNQGLSSAESTIDDYAYFIDGLLELYQSTFNLRYLKIAKQLNT
ncbi:MAG: hypothetical protein U5N58_09310 [Actinomycetota bacterium]|nr:hypothetical protein [Actinomycetota bacterium]